MLAILLAWLYISFLCWAWGILFLQLIYKVVKAEKPSPHFSIICLTGLAAITIIAGILSLFIPLGTWWVQFVFILPALSLFFIKNVPFFFSSLKKEFTSLHITSIIFLCCLLLLILVMSSWRIVHPDTIGYHAQTMQWIEKYKAVPGLVHLHVRFGYQGLWFVDCALFDFSFIGQQGITYLNSTVLLWFVIFMTNRINNNFFEEGRKTFGLLWLCLLSLSLWSYTQLRLTATSASPDFIATIFVLLIIYLLFESEARHLPVSNWLHISLLSFVAVTIKLSVAPVLLIALAASLLFLIKKKLRALFFLLLMAILSFTGFIARNIITTGYVVFPSTIIDVANVDWKYSNEKTVNEKNYITAYAKKQGVSNKEEIDSVNAMSVAEWFPPWWQNRPVADKFIVILYFISFITALLFLKNILREGFLMVIALITIQSGIIFWFINGPDPRFGFGFILGFITIVAYLVLKTKEIFIGKNILAAILISFSMATFSYTTYRVINFFETDQVITPLGIKTSEYISFNCGEIIINSPVDSQFGITPVPCTDLSCDNFAPRSEKIEDGFKAK